MNGLEKDNFSTLCTITASGQKLPLQIIAKGKTERCERSQIMPGITEGENVWVTHSENGWSTIVTFCEYLENLRVHMGDKKIILLLDCYSVHRSQEVKEKASPLGIELIFIPPGMTDSCQPLDYRIFGALKGIAKRLYRISENKYEREKSVAVSEVIQAWKEISSTLIQKAWRLFEKE